MSRSSNIPTKYRNSSTWSRKSGGEHEMGFERRLASSSARCGQSRSQSRSPTPREMVHTSGPIRRGVGLSRLALISPYVRSTESNSRRVLSAPRNVAEVLQSASSPEPLQVEYFDQPQQDGRNRIDDLSECDVVEVGRHILGQSYATVEDIRSFVNELPIESAHVDMASLLDAIQNIDTPNAADLVFPLVGMAALVNTVISANEELKEEVAKLRTIVNSLTRNQLRGAPITREFHYTPTHITGRRVLSSTRAERKLIYNPMRIANKRFPVPSVRGIPAREDLGVYVTELSGDGEFIKDKNVITYIQKISRYIVSRMIPPELYSSFSVRTRERGLKGVTYIDFPQVYLKAIADLHIACCGVQHGDDENEHYIVTASDFAVKTALNDLRRKPPKISAKARVRNEQEYGQLFEGDQATEAISEETFARHEDRSPTPVVTRR